MLVLAHSESGYRGGGLVELWEIHPALTHFPIAFLMAGVVLDVYAWWRGKPSLEQVATGLLVAGFLTGVLAALAGVLAFFTVPAHTEAAHRLMYWHMGIQAGALLLFAWPIWQRWRSWSAAPHTRVAASFAALLLLIGSGIGGYVVYHGGGRD